MQNPIHSVKQRAETWLLGLDPLEAGLEEQRTGDGEVVNPLPAPHGSKTTHELCKVLSHFSHLQFHKAEPQHFQPSQQRRSGLPSRAGCFHTMGCEKAALTQVPGRKRFLLMLCSQVTLPWRPSSWRANTSASSRDGLQVSEDPWVMSKHSSLIKGEELRSYQAQPCGPRQAAFTWFQSSHSRKENNICSPPSLGCWEMAMNVCTVLQT